MCMFCRSLFVLFLLAIVLSALLRNTFLYGFWLPFWHIQSLPVLLSFFIWPLCCLFFDLWTLITLMVSSNSSLHDHIICIYLLLATLITLHGIRNANICTASSKGYSIIPLMKARSRANEIRTITPSNNWKRGFLKLDQTFLLFV